MGGDESYTLHNIENNPRNPNITTIIATNGNLNTQTNVFIYIYIYIYANIYQL